MMQANWSLVLNAILLVGVIVAIGHTLKTKRKNTQSEKTPILVAEPVSPPDEIISVRKINLEPPIAAKPETIQSPAITSPQVTSKEPPIVGPNLQAARSPIIQAALHEVNLIDEKIPSPDKSVSPVMLSRSTPAPKAMPQSKRADVVKEKPTSALMILVSAKENREFAGYDLLQTILGAGLRFGEGQLFHRHQTTQGQGPVLCSLAAATKTGVFDMQNIGAFRVRGLCLFMQTSGNSTIDADRFDIMLETATKLSDDLDGTLLDDRREPFSKMSRNRYDRLLNRENEPAYREAEPA